MERYHTGKNERLPIKSAMTRRTSCSALTGHLRPPVKPVVTLNDGGIEDGIGGKVSPGWIERVDQVVLPSTLEVLELFLARNSLLDIGKGFEVDKLGAIVFVGKNRASTFCVLTNTALETIGNTDVENAVGDVGHEIDVSFMFHNQPL